jgi:hypothetical protein
MKTFKTLGFIAVLFSLALNTFSQTEKLDLSKYGIPITIEVPKGAKVTAYPKDNNPPFKLYITIEKGDFAMQVTIDDLYVNTEMPKMMKLIKEQEIPAQFLKENPSGYIAEKTNYKQEKEYIFRQFLIYNKRMQISINALPEFGKKYSIEEIEKMYASALTAVVL